MNPRLLLVDLNNFARYPSIAIGYLTAILRSGGYDVEVLSPLSTGITGVTREPPSRAWGRLELEFRYRTGMARNPFVRWLRTKYAIRNSSKLARSKNAIVSQFKASLDRGFDAVLVSTYLMYRPHCVAIAEVCRERGLPLILGGPYFTVPDVARAWIDIPGVTALIGGEVEPRLCEIVNRVLGGEPLYDIQGVWRNNGVLSIDAPPLVNLDSLPFPDYRAFPWVNYPSTIVPMITGRGCGWGVCLFCSDVTSTSGRTFRSRSPEKVLAEIQFQHERHSARLFVFTDLKINSNLEMWWGLIGGVRRIVPGARWIGAVHVGSHGDNGLSLEELQQARAAGMVRVTTGLESGSQRVLDKMVKGTDLGATSRFLNGARAADISVRATMIIGYPGEESRDVDETTAFLEKHEECLERISLNRLEIKSGTQLAHQVERKPFRVPGVQIESVDHGQAEIRHRYAMTDDPGYRRAISRLFHVVHRINRKPLRPAARDFEGVM
jgi:radical SAM superfamily enzyme YgiQ (UPF0313 family)